MKALFAFNKLLGKKQNGRGLLVEIRDYLESSSVDLINAPANDERYDAFLAHLKILIEAADPNIQAMVLEWIMQDFVKGHKLPKAIHGKVFDQIRQFDSPSLIDPLLTWLETPEAPFHFEIPLWLSELTYESEHQRRYVIRVLIQRFLKDPATENTITNEPNLIPALKRFDALHGEVTDEALFHFPLENDEENYRLIDLLGSLGRYRVVKPLIAFAEERPRFLKQVMAVLKKFDHPEVDQFFVQWLTKPFENNPMALVEAIRQIRKRRLRKAIPTLVNLFPVDSSQPALINRTINGEISLTMASFGAYQWGCEKLLPQMFLDGITTKYLKAIDTLNLEEAVPLLKAILLAPETPDTEALQHQAYAICERLLTGTSSKNANENFKTTSGKLRQH